MIQRGIFLWILSGLSLTLHSIVFAEFKQQIYTDPASGIKISLSSAYSTAPRTGYFPMRVEITNDSFETGYWTLAAEARSSGGSYEAFRYEAPEMRVSARQSGQFDLLIPLPVKGKYGAYLNGDIAGPGVTSTHFTVPDSPWDGTKTASRYVALSEGAYAMVPMIEKTMSDRGYTFIGSASTNSKLFVPDWRAFAGLGALWITESEWDDLREDIRTAIGDWVASGGEIHLVTAASSRRSKVLNSAVGLGIAEIERLHPSFGLDENTLIGEITSSPRDLPTVRAESLSWNDAFEVRELLPAFEYMTGPVLLLMLLYGVLVGPINLYVLAPKRNMFRLYVTTPLLAIGTCILILLFIFFKDGIGARGHRVVAAFMLPDRNKAVVFQEQAFRTGLMLQHSFDIPPEAMISPLLTGERSLTNSYAYAPYKQSVFNLSESRAWGSWIGSRSIDAHALEAVRTTRGGFRIVGYDGAAPVVISSFNTLIERCFYVNASGKWWFTNDLPPGEKRTFKEFNGENPDPLTVLGVSGFVGPFIRAVLESPGPKLGEFFALGPRDPELVLETAPSVRWKNDRTIYFGPALEGEEKV